jgi:DNA-binding HxlR family transcriptional regulator
MHLFIVSYLLFVKLYDIMMLGVDNMENTLCPKMEETLGMLGKKWVGLIVFTLLDGPKKFSEIEKFIHGISGRVLTERLKELEAMGIINKNIFNETPIRIEYVLTRKGVDLTKAFEKIGEWAEKWV